VALPTLLLLFYPVFPGLIRDPVFLRRFSYGSRIRSGMTMWREHDFDTFWICVAVRKSMTIDSLSIGVAIHGATEVFLISPSLHVRVKSRPQLEIYFEGVENRPWRDTVF